MSNVTMYNNTVANRCGCMCLTATSSLTMSDCNIKNNKVGTRAMLDILQGSSVIMDNVTFSDNESSQDSSSMYVSDATSIIVTNSTFERNLSKNGGNSITLIFSNKISFENCNFTANQATKESSHLYSIFTALTISSCIFDDTDRNVSFTGSITGGFMYLSTGSVVIITNTVFNKGFATYGGAIYILGNADVLIESSNFTSNNADQGAAIHATTYNTLSISNNCIFSSNSANSKVGEWIYVTNAFNALLITNSQFIVNDNAIYLKRTNAIITSCTFTGNITGVADSLNEYAGGIEFEEVATGTIVNSTFYQLRGKGGAFKISSNPYFKNQNKDVSYLITDSTISSWESVGNGGGIYVDTIKELNLTNTAVSSNMALNGEGGGIYFICYENEFDVCHLNLIGSNVTSNSAKIGGGIKWNYSKPTQDASSRVASNTATLYGRDFACFAREIKIINEIDYTFYINEKGINDLSEKTEGSKSKSLKRLDFAGVMSGGSIPTTYLALVDEYNQVVTSDNSVMTEFIVDACKFSIFNIFYSIFRGKYFSKWSVWADEILLNKWSV